MSNNSSTGKLFDNLTVGGVKCGDFGLPECHPEVLYAIPVFIITFSIVTGNFLILVIFARIRNRTVLPVFYLTNLTVADLGLGIVDACFSLPLVLQGRWPDSRIQSDVVGFCVNAFSTASATSLGIVSIDRYIYISRPLTYKSTMTKKVRIIVCAMLWLFSAGLSLPSIFGITNFIYNEHVYLSHVDFPGSFVLTAVYALGILLPVTAIMMIFYARIYRIAKRHIRGMREQGVSHKPSKHVLTTLVFTVLCFIMCWTPYAINEITLALTKSKRSVRILDFGITWLAACNSFLNCLIYWFRQREVRAEARALFGIKNARVDHSGVAIAIHPCATSLKDFIHMHHANTGYQL